MCVTNIYTDRYPDGQESRFRNQTFCPSSMNGVPCKTITTLEHAPRNIQLGESSSAQMFPQTSSAPYTPPRSSSDSTYRRTPSSFSMSTDDAHTEAVTSAGYSYTSAGGTHHNRRGRKSRAALILLGINFGPMIEKSERRRRKEREARKDRIVYYDGPASPRSSGNYKPAISVPLNPPISRNVHFSGPPLGVPFTPVPSRQPPQVITRMPDTPPRVHDAWPSSQAAVTQEVCPQSPTTKTVYPQPERQRSASPIIVTPERERRPHANRHPVMINNPPRARDRSLSPPPTATRPPSTPFNPPAPPVAALSPDHSRSRSHSRVRSAPTTSPSIRPRARYQERSRSRGRSPEVSDPRPRRERQESILRRQRYAAHDEEIRNRPALYPRVSSEPNSSNTPPEIILERERRPYVAPSSLTAVQETSKRLHDAMGGWNIGDAFGTGEGAGDGMVGRGRAPERQTQSQTPTPLVRRNTVGSPSSGGRRRQHQVLYDDGSVRWE